MGWEYVQDKFEYFDTKAPTGLSGLAKRVKTSTSVMVEDAAEEKKMIPHKAKGFCLVFFCLVLFSDYQKTDGYKSQKNLPGNTLKLTQERDHKQKSYKKQASSTNQSQGSVPSVTA